MMTLLIIIIFLITYVLIGFFTATIMLAYDKFNNEGPDYNAYGICAAFWPIGLPTVLFLMADDSLKKKRKNKEGLIKTLLNKASNCVLWVFKEFSKSRENV